MLIIKQIKNEEKINVVKKNSLPIITLILEIKPRNKNHHQSVPFPNLSRHRTNTHKKNKKQEKNTTMATQ